MCIRDRYEHDERIVMTLDAGGTNFVFSAIQGCCEIVEPICLPAASDDLERCLSVLVEGFLEVEKRLPKLPVAISFASVSYTHLTFIYFVCMILIYRFLDVLL